MFERQSRARPPTVVFIYNVSSRRQPLCSTCGSTGTAKKSDEFVVGNFWSVASEPSHSLELTVTLAYKYHVENGQTLHSCNLNLKALPLSELNTNIIIS
jgi:hypothetical protein